MHKNIPVADLELDNATGTLAAVGEVHEQDHVPLGIPVKKGVIDRRALNEWWRGRAIPASRLGLAKALREFQIDDAQLLAEKCFGLSLSDQYWIKPAGSGLSWEKVNFFDHPFSEDVGDILLGKGSYNDGISLMSPDNTSDGWLKKKWMIVNGKRFLVKGGSGATQQEPYNEVLASRIMERLGIPHVPYTLMMQDDYPYSMCEDFITRDTELVTAWRIMQTAQKPNHISVYQHYLNCCGALQIPGIREALERMMVLDYLIVNEDRHQNNFGVIRNADTLKWLGAAPVYDSGTSLWFDRPTALVGSMGRIECKPFKNSHEEQIKLVSSFDWLDLDALTGIDEEFRELVHGSPFIDEARCSALCNALLGRIGRLRAVMEGRRSFCGADDRTGDVDEDVAYSGGRPEK